MKKAFPLVLIFSTATLGIVAFWFLSASTPKPISQDFEFLGSRSYGCWIICDSRPGSSYYYATDLTEIELREYFSQAHYTEKAWDQGTTGAGGNTRTLWFTNTQGEEFNLLLYDDKTQVINNRNLPKTQRRSIIEFDAVNYTKIIKAK